MKKTVKILIIAFLLCIYSYCCKINNIPDEIILYNGASLDIGNFFGISLTIDGEDYNTILTSSSLNEETSSYNTKATVTLFNVFEVKEVSVSIVEETTVIPVGQISGLKLYTNGVLVVGMSEITDEFNQKHKPYEGSGIQEGDTILKIGDQDITDTDNLIEVINSSNGENLLIEYSHDGETKTCQITPIKASDGIYKLGLWVRDSAAGIGTLTFYAPNSGNFAALGHGITDTDTGDLIDIQNGEFITSKIVSIIKGVKGNPRKNTRNN